MATLIAYQNGDWTGATTWKAIATGTNASLPSSTGSTTTTTSYVASSTFTITNAEVLEGLLLRGFRNNTNGTVTIALSDDNGVTATREVTINASDMPTTDAWLFFKFSSTLTADGGNDYRVMIKSSIAGNASFGVSSTSGNWNRIVRTNTVATIASTDAVFIADELTGQGTKNDITVTMNSTSLATSYGQVVIGFGGVLTYGTNASTTYGLKLAGNLFVQDGGTLNIGTSGTRIPSTSTAVLEFNCSTNVQYGLEALNGSTVNIYGAQKGSTKVLLTADCNSGQAGVTVESTSGWAANDIIAVASTTRTASQSEARTISSVTSGTTATVTSNFSNTHQGTAPYQGEVINLTRNVKVQGTSASLQSYVNCAATSNFTADNCEFFWLGSATTNKRGIDSATTSAGSFTLKDCALRDFVVTGSRGVVAAGPSGSPTVDGCVFFGIAAENVVQNATSGVPVYTNNWLISTAATNHFNFNDVGGTITGNRAIGGNYAIVLNESNTIGTFSNNIAHSTAQVGIAFSSRNGSGIISNCTVWRSNGIGFEIIGPITLSNCTSYHNVTANIICYNDIRVIDSIFNGGTGQSLSASARHVDVNGSDIVFENCDFGQTNQATNFVSVTTAGGDATFINCDIAESLTPLNQSNLFSPTSTPTIGIDKLNGTSGAHRAYKQFGFSASDQSVYRTASPSEQLNPNSASGKLPSGSKKFGVASGTTATVSVWVRKSATYNGAEPRLIVKRNVIAGITSDTVLATASGATGTWLELTGTTATVSDDCVLEVYVDCDGTAGVVNVDDWSIT